ncbi:aspartic protease inhibitor [Cucumis melo var. makuwa]|uniref:Aspartic protease inhibitor n=2 Tax=Cucumis melo TaxID=3656 RepID=A0A5A7SJ25_CUCMM|nr:aspartic protease inhibitor [Cucumis melo var. makuwa]TYK07473.1 aspartic protease inhibitor [Cucumis melo var. makuwa]
MADGTSIVIGTSNSITKDDPKVIEMAEYAIREQNQDLILNSVADGQIVKVFLSGNTYYNLVILAHHPHTFQGFYNATVLENTSKNVKVVVSFVPLP